MCFWKRWLAQWASCPVTRVFGASAVLAPPAMMAKHTAVVPLLVHADLSRVSFLILHFNPLHLIFITAYTHFSALGDSQFMLVQEMIGVVCWPPLSLTSSCLSFTAVLSGFHCHPVVSRLSSLFPCVAGPTALHVPDLAPSFALHLVSHAPGSSLQLLCRRYPKLPCCVIYSVGSIARLLSKYLAD